MHDELDYLEGALRMGDGEQECRCWRVGCDSPASWPAPIPPPQMKPCWRGTKFLTLDPLRHAPVRQAWWCISRMCG
eukprot:350178-Chlamydomonas_euryale.AAC.9